MLLPHGHLLRSCRKIILHMLGIFDLRYVIVLYFCPSRVFSPFVESFNQISMRTVVHITSSCDSSLYFRLLRKESRLRRALNSSVHSKGQSATWRTCINAAFRDGGRFRIDLRVQRRTMYFRATREAMLESAMYLRVRTIVRHLDYAPFVRKSHDALKMKQRTISREELSFDLSISDTDSEHLDSIYSRK